MPWARVEPCISTSSVDFPAFVMITVVILPNPLPLGLYWSKPSIARSLGSVSPRTSQSSFCISSQVAVWGSFLIILLPASPTNAWHQFCFFWQVCMLWHRSLASNPSNHIFDGLLIRSELFIFLHSRVGNPTAATNVMTLPGCLWGTLMTEILPGLAGFGLQTGIFQSRVTRDNRTNSNLNEEN